MIYDYRLETFDLRNEKRGSRFCEDDLAIFLLHLSIFAEDFHSTVSYVPSLAT